MTGLIAGLAMAVAAAGDPKKLFIPALAPPKAPADAPGWLVGPLGGLDLSLTVTSYGVLLSLMCVGYLAVVATAHRLEPGWALATVVAAHLVFLLAPPLISNDVFAYIAYARTGATHSLNPYLHPPFSVPGGDVSDQFNSWGNISSPYGPVFTLPSYALSYLGVPAAYWVLKVVTALASLGCVALVWSCAKKLGRDPLRPALIVGLNPLLLVFTVSGAHNDILLVLLMLTGVWLFLHDRDGPAGVATVAAAGLKVVGAVAVPFMMLAAKDRRRMLAGVVAGAAGLLLIGVLAFGPDGMRAWARAVRDNASFQFGSSIPEKAGRLLGQGGATDGIEWLGRIALAGTFGYMLWRVRAGADWIAATGWVVFAVLATVTWLMPWYFVWLLPLAALGASKRLRWASLALGIFIVVTQIDNTHGAARLFGG